MITFTWILMIANFWVSLIPENTSMTLKVVNLICGLNCMVMLLSHYKLI
jgi:hypothetical protein